MVVGSIPLHNIALACTGMMMVLVFRAFLNLYAHAERRSVT